MRKFSGVSVLFDGTGDYGMMPDHADFTLGSGEFKVDFIMATQDEQPKGKEVPLPKDDGMGQGGSAPLPKR